jgi:hypothetical protein
MREIPPEIAAAEGVPEDLDSSALGPYTVPNTTRRRRAGAVYAGGAVLAGVAASTFLPSGYWAVAGLCAAIAAYHFVTGFDLKVADHAALDLANRSVDFPVGHASAAVGFDGWRARPVWNVLVFSADDPPTQRGLVRVDGVDGHVVESYTEPVPPAETGAAATS